MRWNIAVCVLAFALLIVPCAYPQDQQALPAPTPANPTAPSPVNRIRVGGNVQNAKMIRQVQPVYPEIAKKANVSGTVLLHVIVAKDGTVQQIQYISGPPLLMRSSMEAVRQWRYEPTLLNGEPVEVETTVSVVYELSAGSTSTPAPAVDPQFKADVLSMLEATHTQERMGAMGHQMFQWLRPLILSSISAAPNREKIADAFENKFVAIFTSEAMMDKVVSIYAKYLSDDDIKGLIQFYQTPVGQHFGDAMPKITSDSLSMGMELGDGAVPRVWDQICEEYPELKNTAKVCAQHEPTKESLLRLEDRLTPSSSLETHTSR